MLKDMFKRKELICISCQKKIQYEEELVAFVKLPKERSILVGPFDVCLAKTAQEIYCKSCYDKKAWPKVIEGHAFFIGVLFPQIHFEWVDTKAKGH